MKIVMSNAASSPHQDVVVAIIDIRRAYFYAPTKRRIFVELPVEDWQEGDHEDRIRG